MTKVEQNKKWRDRQANMLRDNLKKRKMLQKARLQNDQDNKEDKDTER